MTGLIEELSLNAWPALDVRLYDGWLISASNGFTRRANSVTVVGGSKIPLDEKIRYCERYYTSLGLPAIFKIIQYEGFQELDDKLDKLGYLKIAPTSVRIKKLSYNNFSDNINIDIKPYPCDEWIDEYFECSEKDSRLKSTYALMLKKIKNKGVWVTYKENGKSAGFGYAIMENGYSGIYNLFVPQEYRGRGYAQAIMDKLLYESRRLGAACSYLQVEEENLPAERLYDKLGFEQAYRYYYRKSE